MATPTLWDILETPPINPAAIDAFYAHLVNCPTCRAKFDDLDLPDPDDIATASP
ncbi:hypothetical protein IT415_03165 [bacterium]|nr:hypothetical protein [bacterium]